MKTVKKAGLILVALSLLFVGCSEKEETAQTDTKKSGSFVVGYCINNLNDTFQTYILDAAKQTITGAGGQIEVTDATEDAIKQQDQVNSFIAKGVDGLIVVPVDTSSMDAITNAARNAKIPLCYVNRNPFAGKEQSMPDGVYYVGSQEIVAGQLQGDRVGELLGGKGGVAILVGILGNEGALKRTEGNKEVLTAKYPDIKILVEQTANWQRDQAVTVTENWITTYGTKLNAILSNNDEMALGAIKALQAAGRNDVFVLGVDATADGKAAVRDGSMAATVFQDSKGQGGGAASVITSAIKGNTPEKITWVPFKLVDKDSPLLNE
ncbi:substrate-binding domain-containing protein [Treponema phagedenis]|uniref:Sugar ABC transporter substrate-binding protein n=1 Tax=Treponema phagedenis TaxID=162 RepID=A0AAE6M7P7_TREPH|nr:substrate-binding domain-containing protein [Treponema phagedenis]QEJ98130.1 sugar ABC transporter substrate-binding protein [Treponema phagedenis]QEK00971.1 sugar ABC transporter substrate-binding protein [Treponema phagedenis]QEK05980.1 sugar ABC transporter substrate-binding protein [Treponema phagedenis]QSH94483.1 sugar ABC transporter substrate-binding protein [Treponema phagedenis]